MEDQDRTTTDAEELDDVEAHRGRRKTISASETAGDELAETDDVEAHQLRQQIGRAHV